MEKLQIKQFAAVDILRSRGRSPVQRFGRKFCLLFPALLVFLGPALAKAVITQNSSGGDQQQPALHPVARSIQERDDFKAAYAKPSGVALETAANDFATKYPNSELRRYLYSKAMRSYESENNPAGTLAMAQKVLALNPDDAVALVLTATVLSDRFEAGDPDRSRKAEEVRKAANRAIENVGGGFVAPASASPEELAVYRTTLQSMAYAALGLLELKSGDDAQAEKDFTRAAVMTKVTPDPYIWYHLALAQDHRKKYAAALNSVQQALQLASSHPELQRLAEIEFDRLSGLAGRGPRAPDSTGAEPPQ